MAEPTSFKIQTEEPPTITAEVPGQQQIRELDSNCPESTDTDTCSQGTDANTKYTLSPVITITKNESTLTKGDSKLQKVTFREDIAPQDVENGGDRISYGSASQMVAETPERRQDLIKSKIPQKKFKETVEKVKETIKELTTRDQRHHSRRRSSIPKLKNSKATKRKTSLQPQEQVDDEFNRLYEEIVVNNRTDIQDNLSVKIDDPEKVESKFEEIIHAYDSNDENYLTQIDKIKSSKIPFRKKNKTTSKKDKTENTEPNSSLKDGGYKISANPITLKRFPRSNSSNLNRTLSNENDTAKNDKEQVQQQIYGNITEEKETKTSKIPIKPERINRGLSRELNRRPSALDDRYLVSKEVQKYEDSKGSTSKDSDINTEKIPRGITRRYSRDGISIKKSSKNKTQDTENETLKDLVKTIAPQDSNQNITNNVLMPEKPSLLPTPLHKKTTHSFSKGRIFNVERSKSIEWKTPEVIMHKKLVRSYSEKKAKKYDITHKEKQIVIENGSTEAKIVDINFESSEIMPSQEEISATSLENGIKEANFIDMNFENTEIIPSQEKKTAVSIEISNELPLVIGTQIVNNVSMDTKSDVKNVTVLKGNVGRLISQISLKETDVTKKDIDIKEELPKKKSVLAKIAMFEGKEPGEINIKIKKIIIDNNDESLTNIDNTNAETKSLKERGHTPVVVDQIWKFQEENIPTLNQTVDVQLLPKAIDLIFSESIAIFSNQQEHIVVDQPVPITSDKDKEQTVLQNTKYVPEKLNLKTNNNILNKITTMPANVDLISTENVKFTAEKNVSTELDQKPLHQKEVKVGRLNLDLWKKQVQDNKQLVSNTKYIESNEILLKPKIDITKLEIAQETRDTTLVSTELLQETVEKTDKLENEKILVFIPNENKDIDDSKYIIPQPVKLRNKSVGDNEMPTILPLKKDFASSVSLTEIPKTKNSLAKSEQLQIPVVLPETPLTKSISMDFTVKRNRWDVSTNNQPTTPVNTPDISNTLPEKIEFAVNINQSINKLHSTQNNISLILAKETLDSRTITAPKCTERTDFSSEEHQSEVTEYYPNITNRKDHVEEVFVEDNFTNDNKEIPSDPELVDSETEIKDAKSTIMGKLKNKLYLITNRNVNRIKMANSNAAEINNRNTTSYADEYEISYQNKDAEEIHDNDIENEQDSITNIVDIGIKTHYAHNSVNDFEFDRNQMSFDRAMKRTKSLAELDLGDDVIGQVQRMIFRIKSVDCGRLEPPKYKINNKEMPKSSVMEKIALFEAKAVYSTMPTRKPLETSASTDLQGTSLIQRTEDAFICKVEDSASVRTHKKHNTVFLTLNNGIKMPAIGLGTALLDKSICPDLICAAIDMGFRAFDTAYVYGTEETVGEGLKKKMADGTVTREQLFVSGKLWSTFHKPELVETACRNSLNKLGLEYFDLYMIHNPISLKEGDDPIPVKDGVYQFSQYEYMDAWLAMEQLVNKGLVKSLGLSNFNSKQIEHIIAKGSIKPVVNQVECHPYLNQLQLQDFCKERDIALSCYSVLGSKGTPAEYKAGRQPAIDDPLIQTVALGMNVTPAQLLIRYQIQLGRQAIVKASSTDHLRDILQAYNFKLKPHHIRALNVLNRNWRNFDLKLFGERHKHYPFKIPY